MFKYSYILKLQVFSTVDIQLYIIIDTLYELTIYNDMSKLKKRI